MGSFIDKIDLKSDRGKFCIFLLSLGALVPLTIKVLSQNTYPSLEQAEAACTWWRQSGDVHESLSPDNARQTYGYEVGQGSCDYVEPSLTRRYPMNGKELVLSRLCVNDKENNTIVGKRNLAMENGEWIERKNEGTYERTTIFKY